MKKILSIIILLILVASCGHKPEGEAFYAVADSDGKMMSATRQSTTNLPLAVDITENREVEKKRIIKDGRLSLRVHDLESTKVKIDTLIKIYGGYYANESFNNSDRELSYNLRVRVPSANFELFIAEIEKGDGEILFKEIDARDVTDQFIDLETRLENKRNYLKRYNDLLNRANSVKDILEIEEKIRVLEEEIESTTGRLKYLSDLVDYSTLNLTVSKQKPFRYTPEARHQFSERLKQSLSGGWFGFIDLLLFIIKIWPLWVVIAAIIFVLKKTRLTK